MRLDQPVTSDPGPTIASTLTAACDRLPDVGDLGEGVYGGWHRGIELAGRVQGLQALSVRGLLRVAP